jgi:hypothetical protein
MNATSSPETPSTDSVAAGFDPIHLPIQGEPLPVEFASAWCSGERTMIDFLTTRHMVAALDGDAATSPGHLEPRWADLEPPTWALVHDGTPSRVMTQSRSGRRAR